MLQLLLIKAALAAQARTGTELYDLRVDEMEKKQNVMVRAEHPPAQHKPDQNFREDGSVDLLRCHEPLDRVLKRLCPVFFKK